jgi:hypothetical protein
LETIFLILPPKWNNSVIDTTQAPSRNDILLERAKKVIPGGAGTRCALSGR